jgi:hypothetical protein
VAPVSDTGDSTPRHDGGPDGGPPDGGRRRLLTQLTVAGAAAWVAPVVLSSPASAAGTACPTGTNLVVNGDASDLTNGWTPVLNGGVLAIGGIFEAGGSNVTYESAQTIELGPDCAGATATLSALLRGSHNGVASRVEVTWYSGPGATGAPLGTLAISRTATTFAPVSGPSAVPVGAASARVLLALHGHPAQTRGAADDISLVLA